MNIPFAGEIPDDLVTAAVGGLASGAAGLAAYVARRRVSDRRAAQREAEAWWDRLRRDRDDAYARMDRLEARLDATRRELDGAVDEAVQMRMLHRRQLDAYETELSVVRGENAVMRIQLAGLQEQIRILQTASSGRRDGDR